MQNKARKTSGTGGVKKILLALPAVMMILSGPLYAQVTLSTYNPSPLGVYGQLRFVPRPELTGACDIGTLYANQDQNDKIYYCGESGGVSQWTTFGGDVWTKSDQDIYIADTSNPQNKMVGIGTSTPEFKLTLDNDGGIVALGDPLDTDPDVATLTTAGAGTRFIWYATYGAIRAGTADGTEWDNANIGIKTVGFGEGSLVSGTYATVTGGWSNHATEDAAAISGGYANIATYERGVVNGGRNNQVTWYRASINGGYNNIASRYNASINGGYGNATSGSFSGITGGGSNTASGHSSIISGGLSNMAGGQRSTVSGGANNNASLSDSTIGGGEQNTAGSPSGGDYSTISGGQLNSTAASYATVSGGKSNIAKSNYATVGGGEQNTAGGANATTGTYATVTGGQSNTASANYSFVGGGQNNTANNAYAGVGGGFTNTGSGQYAFVGGGANNTASGDYSTVLGGQSNTAAGAYSLAAGRNVNVTGAKTFAWGYDATNPINVTQSDSFIIATGNVGIGTLTPSAKLHVNGDVRIDTGSLIIFNAPPNVTGSALTKKASNNAVGRDLSEHFESSEEVEAGDVVVLDEVQPDKIKKSHISYDKKVVGVVSGTPAIALKESEMTISPQPFTKGTLPPVAISGRVMVKVSLENGPIVPGDLLTTSSVPGHAMKAEKDRGKTFGTIVGKALEPFDGGTDGETTGVITMFVTMR